MTAPRRTTSAETAARFHRLQQQRLEREVRRSLLELERQGKARRVMVNGEEKWELTEAGRAEAQP